MGTPRRRQALEGFRAWRYSDLLNPYTAGYMAAILEIKRGELRPDAADSVEKAAVASFERVYIRRHSLDEDRRLRDQAAESPPE